MEFAIWHLWDNRKEPPGPSARNLVASGFRTRCPRRLAGGTSRVDQTSNTQWVNEPNVSTCYLVMITIRYNWPFLDFECTCDICRHIHIHTIIGFHCPSWALLCFHCFQSGFGKPFLHSTGHGNDSEWEYVSSEASILTLCQFVNWHFLWVLGWSRCERVDVEGHPCMPVQPNWRPTSNHKSTCSYLLTNHQTRFSPSDLRI